MPNHPVDLMYQEILRMSSAQVTVRDALKSSYGIDYDEAVKNGYFACEIDGEYVKMEKDDKLIKFYRSDIIYIVFIYT